MKGTIEVQFSISNYGPDPRVTTRAILRKKGSNSTGKAGCLIIKPKHEIKKFETLQLIASKYGKLNELDEQLSMTRGTPQITIKGVPAEFIHAKRKTDGSEYDAIVANFGTEETPHLRVFYLNDMHSELLKKSFKSEYKFDLQEDFEEESDEEDDEDSEDSEE